MSRFERDMHAEITRLKCDVVLLQSTCNDLINEIRELNGLERIDFDRMEREAKEHARRQNEAMLAALSKTA